MTVTIESVGQRLQWHQTAAGLLYEATGASNRRFVIAAAGDAWILDMFVDGEYSAEQAVDPQPAATLNDAKRVAQEMESELW